MVIIGGGGHRLATACDLAKTHGIKRVAVVEKDWLGGGNAGRNTTVIRSNDHYPESAALHDLSVRLFEGLSRELNCNTMLSQRGMVILAHSEPEMEIAARNVNAMQINRTDGELVGPERVRDLAPIPNFNPDARYPIHGGVFQPHAGPGRHDAVAWGYAQAADRLGVDIIQQCEVTDFLIEGGLVIGGGLPAYATTPWHVSRRRGAGSAGQFHRRCKRRGLGPCVESRRALGRHAQDRGAARGRADGP